MFGCPRALQIPEELRPPGWVELGREFSLVEDAVYPRDPAVTAAIRRIEPTWIPLIVRWVFLAPADEQTGIREQHVFRYHGLGRSWMPLNVSKLSDDDAFAVDESLQIKALEIPPGYSGPIPRYLDPTVGVLDFPQQLGLQPRGFSPAQIYKAGDLPGHFIPWDWALYYGLLRQFSCEHTVKQAVDWMVLQPRKRSNNERRRQLKDFAQGFVDFQLWADRKIAAASDNEIEQEAARRAEAARQSRLARVQQSMALSFRLRQ